MRGTRILVLMLTTAVAIPAFAQDRVEMPRPGAVSLIGCGCGRTAADVKTLKLPKARARWSKG
jgi:hypothetical protein